jgi:hypothetical protein
MRKVDNAGFREAREYDAFHYGGERALVPEIRRNRDDTRGLHQRFKL